MARAERATYLDLIDSDRAQPRGGGAEKRGRSRVAPLAVAPGTPHRSALQKRLGRHYEQCKKDNRGRFEGQRLKSYCAGVAWTIVKGSGSGPKGATMKRNSKGQFMKKSTRRRPKSGSESRRRAPRPHNVRGYTMKRAGKSVRVRPHRAAAPRASAPRRSKSRRSSSRSSRSRQTNIAIVPVGAREMGAYAPRRRRGRRYYAKAPPMATAGGLVIAGIGSLIGYEMTDLGDRFIAGYSTTASPAPTLPAGVTSLAQANDLAVAAKPTLGRIGWGLGMMILGFGGGALLPWAGMKMFMYGWGLGATAHLGGQLLNGWVVQPLFANTATGQRLFQHETNANAVLSPASTTTTTTTTSTTAGLGAPPGTMTSRRGTPLAAAAPSRLPAAQPGGRIPAALATRAAPGSGQLGQTITLPKVLTLRLTPQQNGSDFHYVPEGTPVGPPATTSPPATQPPATQQPPATSSPPASPTPPAPPASPPPMQQTPPAYPPPQTSVCACSGTPKCSCGQCGQPPEEGYRHPLFRSMNQPSRSWSQRRAA